MKKKIVFGVSLMILILSCKKDDTITEQQPDCFNPLDEFKVEITSFREEDGDLLLSFEDVAWADSFLVELVQDDFSFVVDFNSIRLTSVPTFTSFSFRVKAFNECSETEFTETEEVYVLPSIRSFLKFDGDNLDEITGESHYENLGAIFDSDGYRNSAIRFDGINDYLQLNPELGFKENTSHSISFWMRTKQINEFDLVSQGLEQNDCNPSIIGFIPDNCLDYNVKFGSDTLGSVVFMNPFADHLNQIDSTSFSYADDQWHHYVFVKDRDFDMFRIYIDGEFVNFKTWETEYGYIYSGEPGEQKKLFIGRGVNASLFFEGLLDEVLIVDQALYDDEVARLYGWNGQVE